jgi:hypothetical protein
MVVFEIDECHRRLGELRRFVAKCEEACGHIHQINNSCRAPVTLLLRLNLYDLPRLRLSAWRSRRTVKAVAAAIAEYHDLSAQIEELQTNG